MKAPAIEESAIASITRAMPKGPMRRIARSNQARGDPKARHDGNRKDCQKPAKISVEQSVDRFAIALQKHRDEEKTRAAGEERQENEERQTIGQKPARDRHDLEWNRREAF